MKTDRDAATQPRRSNAMHRWLRRLVSRIPVQWRGAVMLTVLTLVFPLWITLVIWEAVLAEDTPGTPGIEASTPHS